MRLREKMGAVKSLSGGRSGAASDGEKTALVTDSSRRGRRDGNIGDYTRTLWSSLGAGDAAAAAAANAAAADQQGGGGGNVRGGAVGGGVDNRPGGAGGGRGGGGGGGRYWAGRENSNHLRLLAFTETLAAGESALSPGVFEVGGGRRAEVIKVYFILFFYC